MKTLYSINNTELPVQTYRFVSQINIRETEKWGTDVAESIHRQQMVNLINEMPMEALERIFKFYYQQKQAYPQGIDTYQIETSITI